MNFSAAWYLQGQHKAFNIKYLFNHKKSISNHNDKPQLECPLDYRQTLNSLYIFSNCSNKTNILEKKCSTLILRYQTAAPGQSLLVQTQESNILSLVCVRQVRCTSSSSAMPLAINHTALFSIYHPMKKCINYLDPSLYWQHRSTSPVYEIGKYQ